MALSKETGVVARDLPGPWEPCNSAHERTGGLTGRLLQDKMRTTYVEEVGVVVPWLAPGGEKIFMRHPVYNKRSQTATRKMYKDRPGVNHTEPDQDRCSQSS